MYVFRAVIAAALVLACFTRAQAQDWNLDEFRTSDTVELRTHVADEGEYWFPVWVVVVDEAVFVRLGAKAAGRFQQNSTFPEVSIRINGKRFDRVLGEPVPAYAEPVNAAMAEKYASDWMVRWLAHPLTLRLVRAQAEP